MQQLLILTALLLGAAGSPITGSGNLSASYGGEAHFWCTLANSTGVLQVTWQRRFEDDSVENMATFSERFGQQVNEPYRGKVFFTEASLGLTSIALKNLTWRDDGCYTCSFNVYPDGSRKKRACLTVRGISEWQTAAQPPDGGGGDEREDGGAEEFGFNCSATGRPAPTVKWAFPAETSPSSQPQTTVVANGDGTFTSSRRLFLRVPPSRSGHVDCLLNSGMMGGRREQIHFYSKRWRDEEAEGKRRTALWIGIGCVMFLSCVAIAAAIWRKRLNGHKETENVL